VWNILENEQLEDQEGVGKIDIKTNLSQIVRSEVFTVVKNQVKAFWVVMPSSDVEGYQCLEDNAASTSLYPDNWGSTILTNVGILLHHYTVLQPRRP